jgi:hypothetical protein
MPKTNCKFNSKLQQNFLASMCEEMKLKQNVILARFSCLQRANANIILKHIITVPSTIKKTRSCQHGRILMIPFHLLTLTASHKVTEGMICDSG